MHMLNSIFFCQHSLLLFPLFTDETIFLYPPLYPLHVTEYINFLETSPLLATSPPPPPPFR